MPPFHQYLVGKLEENLDRQIVVWYDPRREFEPFVAELRGGTLPAGCAIDKLLLGEQEVAFCMYAGSFFELRAVIEPHVAVDLPAPLVVYVPGVPYNKLTSLLMELDAAGYRWEPQLKQHARFFFRQKFTDGVIDEMLAADSLSYGDIVQLDNSDAGNDSPSVLRIVFPDGKDNAALIAGWLSEPATDTALAAKQAEAELFKLIGSRLGLGLKAGQSIADARTRTARYILVNEWRSSLDGKAPDSVSLVPAPSNKEQHQFVRDVCQQLRRETPGAFERLADQVESELRLSFADAESATLTFRFQENAALQNLAALIADRKFDQTLHLVTSQVDNFWIQHSLARKAQWEACRLMAELGQLVKETRTALRSVTETPLAWLHAYAADDGWYRTDQLQRRLEAWISTMEEESEAQQALGMVRQDYEELIQEMATRFMSVLEQAQWHFHGAQMQTHVYQDAVKPGTQRVAYFVVDALRYEMAVELRKHLEDGEEVTLRAVVAAVPSITKIGMAALLPGAASSFDLVVQKSELAASINGTVLPALPARQRHLKASVPGVVDLELHKVLQLSKSQLSAKIDGATLVMVRSQEIDFLGETGNYLARQVMDTVIGNVARAVRRLAATGIEQFIITADHGHLFGLHKHESMRTDSPGGEQIELHRRCWAGRGGQTPPGTIRIAASDLGYSCDLDFVFPKGAGVFRSGGDLAYHHGGMSLQELVVPVLCLRVRSAVATASPETNITIKGMPATITNRTFGIELMVAGNLFASSALTVRPLILSEGQQVGEAGMTVGADFDSETGCVTLRVGTSASIGLFLKRDDCKRLRVVIQDPANDRVLVQSEEVPVKFGM